MASQMDILFKKEFSKCDCVYTPRKLIEDMRRDYGIDVTYRQAYAGCKRGNEVVRGSPDESYQYLVGYSHMLELHNPGTITTIKTDANDAFLYYFFCDGGNIIKKFHNVAAAKAFMRDAKAYTDDDYRKAMFWARIHEKSHRFTLMTINISESCNSLLLKAITLPIIYLIDFIRSQLMDWFSEHRDLAMKYNYH
ncbi:hypothetical protein MKX01_020566 [Papaver californicum]|nr:hypothetical protein MKX01_020566 [Papaver californicum]